MMVIIDDDNGDDDEDDADDDDDDDDYTLVSISHQIVEVLIFLYTFQGMIIIMTVGDAEDAR